MHSCNWFGVYHQPQREGKWACTYPAVPTHATKLHTVVPNCGFALWAHLRQEIIYPPGRIQQLAAVKLTQVVQGAHFRPTVRCIIQKHINTRKKHPQIFAQRHALGANTTRTLQASPSMNIVGELGGGLPQYITRTLHNGFQSVYHAADSCCHTFSSKLSIGTPTSQLELSNGIRLAGATTAATTPPSQTRRRTRENDSSQKLNSRVKTWCGWLNSTKTTTAPALQDGCRGLSPQGGGEGGEGAMRLPRTEKKKKQP